MQRGLTKSGSRSARGLLGRTFQRSWLRPLARAVTIAALVVLVAVGAAIAVVLSGPTEISILRSRVEQTVAAALGPGYRVQVGRTTVDVDPALGLVVLVDEVTVRDGADEVVASIPSTRLAVDPMALLTLRGLIRSVELNGPEIFFNRGLDGQVSLGRAKASPAAATIPAAAAGAPLAQRPANAPGRSSPATGGFPDLLAALQILDTGIEPSVQAALRSGFEHFAMVQANIGIADATFAEERHFLHTDLSVTVNPSSAAVTVNLNASGYSGRWSATAERTSDPNSGERYLTAMFSQLTLADIFPRFGEADSPLASDVPLYGRATVRLRKGGEVEDANVRLDLGAGTIAFRGGQDSVLLDEATIKLRWDIANNQFVVDPSPFYFGRTRGTVVGTIRPLGDPNARRYAFALESPGAILAARDTTAPALVAQRMAVAGTADLPAKLLTIDNAVLASAGGSILGSGSIDFNGESPSVVVAASMTPMSVDVAKQMWPPFIVGNARRWALDHVLSGRIASGVMEAAIPAGVIWTAQRKAIPEDALRIDFKLENVSFTTIGDVPPIVNAYGNASLAGSTFGIDIERGQVVTPSGRKVEITAGAFAVPTTVPIIPDGHVEIQMAGDVAGLAEIADSQPFNALKRQKILPTALAGTGTANLSARWPMRLGLTESDVDWRVAVQVNNFSSTQPILGRTISEGKVNIIVNPDDISLVGRAKIDGVIADVNLSQPINEEKAQSGGKRSVRMTLDEQARKRLGMGLEDVVGGTIEALVSEAAGGGKGQHYDIDLKQARLTLSALGWSKGIGVPARISFDLFPGANDGYRVDNVRLQGDGFSMSAKAQFDSKYTLLNAEVSELVLKKGDEVGFTLRRDKGGYIVSASGKSFDLRGLLQRVRKPFAHSSAAPDLTLDAKVDRIVGFNNETLAKGEIGLTMLGGALRRLEIKGALGNSSVSASLEDQKQGATLSVATNDAGALLRYVDLYPRVVGGALRLQGRRIGENEAMVGTFDVSNFNIAGEPVMARFASTADNSDGFNPNSVPFTRMQLGFTMRNSVLVIDDAVLKSNTIGATFDGRLDLAGSEVLLQGTYLPAYPLNNMFGRIPVLGLALGGGSKGGLVGVTFKVAGSLDSPSVQINALSAIAPGIFRKIFEFH